MKKSILSAPGLAVALAFAMPALGNCRRHDHRGPGRCFDDDHPGSGCYQAGSEEGRQEGQAQEGWCQEGREERQGKGCSEGLIRVRRHFPIKAAPAATGWGGLLPGT